MAPPQQLPLLHAKRHPCVLTAMMGSSPRRLCRTTLRLPAGGGEWESCAGHVLPQLLGHRWQRRGALLHEGACAVQGRVCCCTKEGVLRKGTCAVQGRVCCGTRWFVREGGLCWRRWRAGAGSMPLTAWQRAVAERGRLPNSCSACLLTPGLPVVAADSGGMPRHNREVRRGQLRPARLLRHHRRAPAAGGGLEHTCTLWLGPWAVVYLQPAVHGLQPLRCQKRNVLSLHACHNSLPVNYLQSGAPCQPRRSAWRASWAARRPSCTATTWPPCPPSSLHLPARRT